MRDAPPSRDEIHACGVLPTAAALIAAAVILIEREQVDWKAGPGALTSASQFVWVLAPFVFGLAHTAGSAKLSGRGVSWSILNRVGVFIAAYTPGLKSFILGGFLPLGAYLHALAFFPLMLMLSLGGGLDGPPEPYTNTMVFGVINLGASFVLPSLGYGSVLTFAAGPPWRSTAWADWKRLIALYSLGALTLPALFAPVLAMVENFNRIEMTHRFGLVEQVWQNALIVFALVIISCSAIWLAAFKAYWRSGNVLKCAECWKGFARLAAIALALAALVQIAVANRMTLFGENAGGWNPVANFIRGSLPTASARVVFGEFEFVGPRPLIAVRRDERGEMRLISNDWVEPPQNAPRHIEMETPERAAREAKRPKAKELDCRQAPDDRLVCADLAEANGVAREKNWPTVPIREYASSAPEASLTYWVPLRGGLDALLEQKRQYCTLELNGVPGLGYRVSTLMSACGDDWPAHARRLKAMVEGWFRRAP